MLPHDYTAAFRARLSSCSHLEAGFGEVDEGVAILLRISFKRDGTLASPPKLLDAEPITASGVSAANRRQCAAKVPALYRAPGGQIQRVEDTRPRHHALGPLRRVTARLIVRLSDPPPGAGETSNSISGETHHG